MTAPDITHPEADFRAVLDGLGELEVNQQAKELGAQFHLTPGQVLKFWGQQQKVKNGNDSEPKVAGRPIGELLKPAEPWPEPVDAGDWLEECERELRRYLAMPKGAHRAVAAWCFYTHVSDRFGYSPYIIATSPAPECGKTTVLRACHRLAALPLFTGSMTTATLFRVMDEHHPVMLCDEQDGRMERNEELRLLFNEGFQKGSHVIRCIGDDNEARGFNCFGPKALACIGELPATVTSRSIVLRLERNRQSLAVLAPLDHPEALTRLRRQAARWAQDHGGELREVPEVPGFDGRLLDKWGPLLAVAEAAGSDWLERVAQAAQALQSDEGEQPEHLTLLADLGHFLLGIGRTPENPGSLVLTDTLLGGLKQMTESPWADEGKEGITAHRLADMLRPFGIRSKQQTDGDRLRGYEPGPILRAFETYIPNEESFGPPSETVPTVPGNGPNGSNALQGTP